MDNNIKMSELHSVLSEQEYDDIMTAMFPDMTEDQRQEQMSDCD